MAEGLPIPGASSEEVNGAGEPGPRKDVTIPHRELLAVWKVIEKLMVSADRIAGVYEYSREGEDERIFIDEEVMQEHDRSLREYLEELNPELVETRNVLIERLELDPDEADHLIRNVIQYREPDRPTFDYEGDDLAGPDIALD